MRRWGGSHYINGRGYCRVAAWCRGSFDGGGVPIVHVTSGSQTHRTDDLYDLFPHNDLDKSDQIDS